MIDLGNRRTYWNPNLDDSTERYESDGGPLEEPGEHPANLVSSLCQDGKHRPAIDFDLNVDKDTVLEILAGFLDTNKLSLVRSTTNWHIYSDEELTWDEYSEMLCDMADHSSGFMEGAYVDHSLERGQSLLRMPGQLKKVAA